MQNVSVRIEGTGGHRNVSTDAEGKYRAELPPGSYRVVVTQEGFRQFQSPSFGLQPGKAREVNVQLAPLPGASITTAPTPSTAADSADTVEIDFEHCAPERRRIDVTYGYVTYEIVGKSGDECVMKYGKSIENPSRDTPLNTTCAVPTRLGKQKFRKTATGVDFSSLEPFCKPAS
jgi:hypothetical protein